MTPESHYLHLSAEPLPPGWTLSQHRDGVSITPQDPASAARRKVIVSENTLDVFDNGRISTRAFTGSGWQPRITEAARVAAWRLHEGQTREAQASVRCPDDAR